MFRSFFLSATVLTISSTSSLGSVINGDYAFNVVLQTRALAQNVSYDEATIRNDGTVIAEVGGEGGASNLAIISPDGSTRVIDGPPDMLFQHVAVNESGQIVVAGIKNPGALQSAGRRQVVLIEPDLQTFRTLIDAPVVVPLIPGTGYVDQDRPYTDSTVGNVFDVKVNASGEVAVAGSARLADGTSAERIYKITDTSSGTPAFTKLDETISVPFADRDIDASTLAIDDAGAVAWGVTDVEDGVKGVLASDGSADPSFVLKSSRQFGQLGYRPSDLTNSGLLAVESRTSEVLVGTSDITDNDPALPETIEEDVDVFLTQTQATLTRAFDVNEFGQFLGLVDSPADQGGGAFLDGDFIVGTGEMIDGFTLGQAGNFSGFQRANNGQFLNDAGQFAFQGFGTIGEGNAQGIDAGRYRLVVRADPIGATPENPILPDGETDGVFNVAFELVNALGTDSASPIYIDPVFGTGLSYEIANGGPNFFSLTVPSQDLGGLATFDVLFDGLVKTIGFGETLDFMRFIEGGVSSFEIFGANGGSDFDTDFVASFTFAEQGSVELEIRNVERADTPAPIPLPAAAWMLLMGLGALGLARVRQA